MKQHKQMYYFETKKVRPSLEDGRYVLAWDGIQWIQTQFLYLLVDENNGIDPAEYYSHWMQMPEAPCDDDKHAFLD